MEISIGTENSCYLGEIDTCDFYCPPNIFISLIVLFSNIQNICISWVLVMTDNIYWALILVKTSTNFVHVTLTAIYVVNIIKIISDP